METWLLRRWTRYRHGASRDVRPAMGAAGAVTALDRPGVRAAAATIAALVLWSGCSSDQTPDPEDDRTASVYVAIVGWFAGADDTDPDPLPVFVEPRGDGATIPLEAQTALIAATADQADVRFIDAREEALVEDAEGRLVAADGGVLLRLPPVDQIARPVVADVDVHLQDDRFLTLRFELEAHEDGWRPVGPPEQIAIPEEGRTQDQDGSGATAP